MFEKSGFRLKETNLDTSGEISIVQLFEEKFNLSQGIRSVNQPFLEGDVLPVVSDSGTLVMQELQNFVYHSSKIIVGNETYQVLPGMVDILTQFGSDQDSKETIFSQHQSALLKKMIESLLAVEVTLSDNLDSKGRSSQEVVPFDPNAVAQLAASFHAQYIRFGNSTGVVRKKHFDSLEEYQDYVKELRSWRDAANKNGDQQEIEALNSIYTDVISVRGKPLPEYITTVNSSADSKITYKDVSVAISRIDYRFLPEKFKKANLISAASHLSIIIGLLKRNYEGISSMQSYLQASENKRKKFRFAVCKAQFWAWRPDTTNPLFNTDDYDLMVYVAQGDDDKLYNNHELIKRFLHFIITNQSTEFDEFANFYRQLHKIDISETDLLVALRTSNPQTLEKFADVMRAYAAKELNKDDQMTEALIEAIVKN